MHSRNKLFSEKKGIREEGFGICFWESIVQDISVREFYFLGKQHSRILFFGKMAFVKIVFLGKRVRENVLESRD